MPHLGLMCRPSSISVWAAARNGSCSPPPPARQKVPLLIGHDGANDAAAAHTGIEAAAKPIPILWSGNYSVGVNLLFWLTESRPRASLGRITTAGDSRAGTPTGHKGQDAP